MSPGLRRVLVDLGLDRRVDAERRVTRFLCCDCFACSGVMHAAVDLFLQQRMVARHLLELAAAQPVQARVADVRRPSCVLS